MNLKNCEFWFAVGSQFLYGSEVLDTVAICAAEMAEKMNGGGILPCKLVYKLTAKTAKEISNMVRKANYDPNCAGIVTQHNRDIPNDGIDMDFMNLNQAAHGDREQGVIGARLRIARKVVVGCWQDERVLRDLGDWMRAAVGVAFSKTLKVMRFGDNMCEVAVTEGNKVEVQTKLGWEVNTWPVGQLVEYIDAVTDSEVDALMAEHAEKYTLNDLAWKLK